MFALIDCNNFYASCERLFRPDLYHEPIIVLSNNDGCVIARSNEAKALGIAMGEPYFKIKPLCKKSGIHVFSSNYSLYGDMSYRVMSIIEDHWAEVDVYSIDEAFLNLSSMPLKAQASFCQDLQKKLLKDTGIPTSIGIGSTKTLAKAANFIAKKLLKTPVVAISNASEWLTQINIGDVWGVGHQWQKKLTQRGITTAADLAAADPNLIKNAFNIILMRTAMELRGIPCTTSDGAEKRQSIMSSKSFGTPQTDYQCLAQAISSHCRRAYDKLRQQHLAAQHLSVFVHSNRFRNDLPQYHNAMDLKLIQATDNLCYLTHAATFCLKKIYKEGIQYQKVGVLISDLIDKNTQQMDLFHPLSEDLLLKNEQIMSVFDAINHKFGRHTMHLAAESSMKPWSMKQQMKSPHYTTQWHELAKVIIT